MDTVKNIAEKIFSKDELAGMYEIASRRADEAESKLSKAIELLKVAPKDIYRQCSNCAHWVPGPEAPKKCKAGGCLNILKPDRWEWRHAAAMRELGI